MSTKKLTDKELKETNGGSIFGGDSTNQNGSSVGLGIDNLVSGSHSSTDGDESSDTSFSLGNGIGANLDKLTKSSNS